MPGSPGLERPSAYFPEIPETGRISFMEAVVPLSTHCERLVLSGEPGLIAFQNPVTLCTALLFPVQRSCRSFLGSW